MNPPTKTNKLKPIDINHFAFYQGAQGIPFTETSREIDALHRQMQSKLDEDSAHKQKPLEAVIEKLEHVQDRVEGAWLEIEQRLGPHSPPVVTAILVGFLALAAQIIDSIMLGPGLDAVGISEPVVQFIAAFGLASLSSLVFHLVLESFTNHQLDLVIKIAFRILGAFTVVALIGWGVLRGFQVRFSADLNQNPLGRFLGEHPILSSIFFCFVTLAVPLVGAAAIHYAQPRIYDWLCWKRAKGEHDGLHSALSDARKKLEAERSSLDHQKSQLDAQKQTWQSSAAQYHDRGDKRGARQVPQWLVVLKAAVWSLVGLAVAFVVGPILPVLYAVLPAGAGIAGFLYYRHRRFHPTYDQFKGQENTHFAVSTDRSQPRIIEPATPRLLPPPEDKDEDSNR